MVCGIPARPNGFCIAKVCLFLAWIDVYFGDCEVILGERVVG